MGLQVFICFFTYLSSRKCVKSSFNACMCRLQGDHVEITSETGFKPNDEMMVRSVRDDFRDEKIFHPCLLTIPSDVLKTILDFCVGVEYLNL